MWSPQPQMVHLYHIPPPKAQGPSGRGERKSVKAKDWGGSK